MGAEKKIYADKKSFVSYFYKKLRNSDPKAYKVRSDDEVFEKYNTDLKFKIVIDLQQELICKKYINDQSNAGKIRGKSLNKELYIMSDGEILKGHTSVMYYQVKNESACAIEEIKTESPKYKDILSKYETIRKERQDEWNRTKNTPEQIQFIRSSAGASVSNQTLYVMSDGHICKTKNTTNKYIRNFKTEIIEKVTVNDGNYLEIYEIYCLQEQKITNLRKKYGRKSCILYVLEDGTIHSVTLNKMSIDFDISKTVYTIMCDEEGYDNLREEYTMQTRQHVLDDRKKEARDKANKIISKLNKDVFTLKELKLLLVKLGMKESYYGSCTKFGDVKCIQKAKSRHSDTIYKLIAK
jgi:hypothetical protein